MKRIFLAFAFVALLNVACGTEDTDEPGTPEPAVTQGDDTGGGGTMDDQDIDY